MKDFQYITNAHPQYIENLYNDFVKNPESVDADLRKFFEGFDFAVTNANGKIVSPAPTITNGAALSVTNLDKEFSVYQLIHAYRRKGHLIAQTNPIRQRKDRMANLELENFGLTNDLATEFEAGKFVGLGRASLQNIVAHLQKCYTAHLGIEFSAVNSRRKIDWIIDAVENKMLQPISLDQKKRILQKLNEGVMFEKFLHTK